VLRRGDPERGTLLLVVTSRGRHIACLQRSLEIMSGQYEWTALGPGIEAGSNEISDFLAGQARFDPDSWQIELDIALPERFIDETIASG
jgi:hypothetical protein